MRNVRKLSALLAVLALVVGLGQVGLTQAPQGVIVVPPSNQIQVDISVPKSVYQVGEEIQIYIQTTVPDPSVTHVYLNVVDIDAAGKCTLIFPNAFSPNPLVPVGNFILPDKPNIYRFQIVPPAGIEYVQAFASLDPLDLRQLFNAPTNPSDPFPSLCNNPQEFAQQVQAAIQGIVAVGRIATDWTSFTVVGGPPPPPPANNPPVAQFTMTPATPFVGQMITFTSTSFDPDGDAIIQHFWNFGDGFTSVGSTVFHAYAVPGVYTVTLTVTDSRGLSSSTARQITVLSPIPPPTPLAPGFYIDAVDETHFRISVQGSSTWFTPHAFKIQLETDGQFVSIQQQMSGNVAPQGIVPQPVGSTLEISGAVGSGRIDYIIGISPNATKIKFKLLLDTNGDGTLERSRNFVYLGSQFKHPPSNPFVISFPAGRLIPFVQIQVCLTLIDVPGFQFIICFNFSSL